MNKCCCGCFLTHTHAHTHTYKHAQPTTVFLIVVRVLHSPKHIAAYSWMFLQRDTLPLSFLFLCVCHESIYSIFCQTMCCICVYSFGNNNIDNCLRDGGVAKGRGTHFEHVPTNELYCAPGDVYDSFKPLCLCMCVCVCVPTYWQLRDLNSLLFSLIFICYSPVLLSSCLLFPISSYPPFPSLYLISSFCPFPLSSCLCLLSSTIFHTQSRFCSITAPKNLSSVPLFRV